MLKAVFWDRDGVLAQVLDRGEHKNVGAQTFEQFQLIPGVKDVLQRIRQAGYLNIVVTNQPDVSRKIISWETLNRMHDFLKNRVLSVDAIYVCPHTSEENCRCRKPKPGLLFDAAKDYHLDLSRCFMIGDSQSDIDAARNARVKAVLLKAAYNQGVKGQDYTIAALDELSEIIV